MSFWQDARALPERRILRRGIHDRRAGRRRPLRRARAALLLGAGAALTAAIAGGGLATSASPAPSEARSVSRGGVVARRAWRSRLAAGAVALVGGPDDVVVLTSASVAAVARHDGAPRWETRLEDPGRTLAADDRTVVVADGGRFVGLDRRSGVPRWVVPTPEPPGAVAISGSGERALVVVTTDAGGVAALDPMTGVARWSVHLRGAARGALGADRTQGSVVGVWQDEGSTVVRAVDAAGSTRWEQPLDPWAGTPVVTGDLVVVGAGDGHHVAAVRAFGVQDGAPRWTAPVPASFQPDLHPAITRDAVVAVDELGDVVMTDRLSGRRRWRTDLGAAVLAGGPVVVGDAVCVPTQGAELVVLDRVSGHVVTRQRAAGLPVAVDARDTTVVVGERLGEATLEAYTLRHSR